MTEKIQTNIIESKLIDETHSINKSENNENKISLIRPCLESPKEKKGLFILQKEPQPQEKKENAQKQIIQLKKQINLSPFQFHFPLKLSQNLESKEKESIQKESKENSDFEIDVMTESWGLNKLEKMEKELDASTENEKLKIDLNNKKKEKEKDNVIEEINIANEEIDEDISISKNSIIDITEMRGSDIEKDEQTNKDKDYSFNESVQKVYDKNKYLRGHCPFNFFEKEKCKNVDFKKVNVRSYISAISAQWKVMTDKEKEPYVKLSEEFKRKILASNNLDDLEEIRLSNKKRKRRQRIANKGNKNSNNNNINTINKQEPKIINNNINFNNNKIENFSVYTTNKYMKNKANTNKIMNETNSNENKSIENESSSYVQQTLDKSENEKKENSNILDDISEKYKIIKRASKTKTNEYIKSVLIPFVVKSLEFLDSLRSDNINE